NPGRVEAGYEREIRLHAANDVAEIDRRRRPRQAQPAILAANGRDIAHNAELVRHLHEMVARNTIAPRDVVDRRKPRAVEREIDEGAQAVIGIGGQPHEPSSVTWPGRLARAIDRPRGPRSSGR